jgi:hypothetical protein
MLIEIDIEEQENVNSKFTAIIRNNKGFKICLLRNFCLNFCNDFSEVVELIEWLNENNVESRLCEKKVFENKRS